jgi:hypothetical protein
MKKERCASLQLRTNRALAVEVTTQQIDPRYKLLVNDAPVSTETGELRLFTIEPQQPGIPSLSGRWDHEANTVDIDVLRNGCYEKPIQGHHTVADPKGIYHIDVYIREGNIFTGSIRLGTELGLSLRDSI